MPNDDAPSSSTPKSARRTWWIAAAVVIVFVVVAVVAILVVNSSSPNGSSNSSGAVPSGSGTALITWSPVGSTTGSFSQPYGGTIAGMNVTGSASLSLANFAYTYTGTVGGHPYNLSMSITGGYRVTGTYDGQQVAIAVTPASSGAHFTGTIGDHQVVGTVTFGGHRASANYIVTH